jgi:hypothetical protein
MRLGELFKDREAHLYPSPDMIVAQELEGLDRSYPGAKNDIERLAFCCRNLKKHLANERERADAAGTVMNEMREK